MTRCALYLYHRYVSLAIFYRSSAAKLANIEKLTARRLAGTRKRSIICAHWQAMRLHWPVRLLQRFPPKLHKDVVYAERKLSEDSESDQVIAKEPIGGFAECIFLVIWAVEQGRVERVVATTSLAPTGSEFIAAFFCAILANRRSCRTMPA